MGGFTISDKKTKLEDILNEEIPENNKDGFIVDSIEKASWVAGKFLDAQRRVEKRLIQNEQFKEKIDLWLERANEEDLSIMDYMRAILEPYVEESFGSQTKIMILPVAKMTYKKSSQILDFSSEDMALRFCESYYPRAVEKKNSIVKPVLKSILSQGKIIPGVKLIPGTKEMLIEGIEEKEK